MIQLVEQYLAYSNNTFALLHEPTLWQQVESVLESQRVKKLDVFIVTSEQSSAGADVGGRKLRQWLSGGGYSGFLAQPPSSVVPSNRQRCVQPSSRQC
jgi:hypothetical protein